MKIPKDYQKNKSRMLWHRYWMVFFHIYIFIVINHIHNLGILHKDIKFDNILIEKGQIKIIDFGLAALRENWDHRCGTCGYMAPEIF